MSLATRCPVCQTVFRVVQDQLKVSEGWVRCGRCAKVFNAFEGLFDLEREFPALRQPTPSQRVLEDLATRNRQPRASTPWQDEFDSPSSPGEMPQPAPAAASPAASAPVASRPAAAVASAPAPVQRLPAQSAPPPIAAARAPAAPVAQPPTPVGAAPSITSRETTPWAARVVPAPPATAKDEGATIPPTTVAPPGKTAEPAKAQRPAFTVPAPAATVPPAPVAAAKPQPALPATTARAGRPEIAIRDEPTAVPGDAAAPDSDDQDESFDALFHSDGELAQPRTAVDDPGIDIVLDGADVEPASLDPDDAVDSRLLTFVQEADRAERWRRPWVRAALVLSALALALLLAAQLLIVQRDVVVAQWPGTRSLVQSLCAPLNCRIEPLRRIDQITVDSSGLTRIDDGPVYRLVLVLHNRTDTALLMPAIDLSLTDAAGVLVSRRMLSASDLGSVRSTIAAGQEVPLQALLMSADRALTGYTIEIFYP